MTKFKKTNKVSMDDIFVVKGDRVVPTGDFATATTALNLQDGQLGVLAWDFDSTVRPLGEYKRAGDDSNEVQAIKVVVGTPKSQKIHLADIFEAGDKGFLESGVINKTNIRSVSVKLPEYPVAGAQCFEFAFTPVEDTEYKAYIRLKSVRNDRFYGDNDEVIHAVVPAIADLTTITNDQSFVLEQLAYTFNLQSKAVSLTGSNGNRKGNRNVVVFGVDSSGASGTVVGDITVGTSIPFMTVDGVSSNYIADEALVQALAALIADSNSVINAASTIENLQYSTNSNFTLDTLVVVGLAHNTAAAYDDVEQVMVQPELNLAGGFRDVAGSISKGTDVNASEGTGQGSKWLIEWRHRAGLAVHTAQLQPRGDWFIEGKNYINPDYFYTSYILEYFDTEDTLTSTEVSPKRLILLFRAEVPAAQVLDVDTISGETNAKIPFITSNGAGTGTDSTLTVTYVNNILDAWLEHARTTGNPFSLKGDIAGGGVYLQ
jgi:hypothetical protein